MKIYERVMALTGGSRQTPLGQMALRVLYMVSEGATVDRDILEWAAYIVADTCGHPCDADYETKLAALAAGK